MMKVVTVQPGFYWVKYRPGSRWQPAEYDGWFWLIGDGTGGDLYLIGPRIMELLNRGATQSGGNVLRMKSLLRQPGIGLLETARISINL